MADEGSNGVALSTSGYSSVAGVDGSAGNAIAFTSGQAVFSTDAGLPVGLATRSYGIWVKTISLATMTLMEWGTASTGHVAMYFNSGSIGFASAGDAIVGPFIADGLWRHLVVVENNTSSDGIKRKLYVDRRLVAISTVLNPVVLAGANNMRIGLAPTGATPFVGEVDSAFICDYALTPDHIAMLYAKGSQALTRSPKNVGDHIEGMDTNNLYATFDALEVQHQVDIGVAS